MAWIIEHGEQLAASVYLSKTKSLVSLVVDEMALLSDVIVSDVNVSALEMEAHDPRRPASFPLNLSNAALLRTDVNQQAVVGKDQGPNARAGARGGRVLGRCLRRRAYLATAVPLQSPSLRDYMIAKYNQGYHAKAACPSRAPRKQRHCSRTSARCGSWSKQVWALESTVDVRGSRSWYVRGRIAAHVR